MKRQARQRRRGFTLLEVLLVVGILVALAAIAVPQLMGVQEGAKIDEARIQVKAIDEACKLYSVHTGGFPPGDAGLASLESPPNPAPQNWRGPYLEGVSTMRDPWNSAYNYQYPGSHRAAAAGGSAPPDVWSNGPDRQSGTADDIGNWPAGK